jgi:hypothetical protein
VINNSKLELWLGEVKFYSDYSSAITEVIKELIEHTKYDYLRNEKMLLLSKIDTESSFSSELSELLDANTSLDKIFDCACIPILITYNSNILKKHQKTTDKFNEELENEIMEINQKMFDKISEAGLPSIKVHLFFTPIAR